ncbi:amidohydrolase family protein [Thalassotalea atypica]|uniref:amidohydrolase family protein n=1 Tax=Thalassotalea atypica TaxID=2054316 RepID=UPI00257320F8|nr:amidohydrolase family protein [Thalassotalea atypica]
MKALLQISSLAIPLLFTQPVFGQNIALKHVNVIDVIALAVKKNQTVVIKNDRIHKVGNADDVDIDKNTISIDMSGKYMAPGLIDGHVHHATDPDDWDNRKITEQRLRTLLRGGVTSVRDMGGDNRVLSSLARDAMLDQIQSPDIYYSVIVGGPEFFADPRTVSSAKGQKSGQVPWMASITEKTNLDHVMLKALGTGATGIKIYAKVPKNLIPKLSNAAQKHGLKVWSHVYIGPTTPSEAIMGGVETLSHVPDFSAEIIENYAKWRRQNIAPDPTQENASYNPDSYGGVFDLMLEHNTILDATMTVFESRKQLNENTQKRYRHTKMLTQLAHQKGVTISAGTDAFSDTEVQLYKELSLLVYDGGLSPIQALQAATINNAKVIGQANNIGSINAGKKANLIVFSADPTQSIADISSVKHVMKNGKFIYRGDNPELPFSSAKKVGNTLWMSGQIGNLPSTMALASSTIEGQVRQTMENIGIVLQEHGLSYGDVTKCTMMLADINEWAKASNTYKSYFTGALPTRSAFAAAGLALDAKVEIECLAHY